MPVTTFCHSRRDLAVCPKCHGCFYGGSDFPAVGDHAVAVRMCEAARNHGCCPGCSSCEYERELREAAFAAQPRWARVVHYVAVGLGLLFAAWFIFRFVL
jgi:hypothetical protein